MLSKLQILNGSRKSKEIKIILLKVHILLQEHQNKFISGLIKSKEYSIIFGKYEEPSLERNNLKTWDIRGNSKRDLDGNLKKNFKGNLKKNFTKKRVVSKG